MVSELLSKLEALIVSIDAPMLLVAVSIGISNFNPIPSASSRFVPGNSCPLITTPKLTPSPPSTRVPTSREVSGPLAESGRLIPRLPLIFSEPVISWISAVSSPNFVLPLSNITDALTNSV